MATAPGAAKILPPLPGRLFRPALYGFEVAHEQIVQGNLELGVITLAPKSHERLNAVPVWRDELVFMCAADHPLNQTGKVYIEQLPEYPAILPDMSTFTGRIVKSLFEERGLTLNVSMSTNYLKPSRC